jgi:hypothetical protein
MAGCHGVHQLPGARPSGFPGDYSQLRPGRENEAPLVCVNTRVDLSKYNAVLLPRRLVQERKLGYFLRDPWER